MTIHQAIDRILGRELANSIVNDMGLHWAVVAAMAECRVSHGPEVKTAISNYLKSEDA